MVDGADQRRCGGEFSRHPRRPLGHTGGHALRLNRRDLRAHLRAAIARSTIGAIAAAERAFLMTIDKYISVFNIGIQNTFVYRWNYFLRALFGLVPLAGTVFLWNAVFKERGGSLHGYDYASMIYYYLLTILVSNLVTPTEDEWQIAADIREGQINSLLTKPMSYLAYRFGEKRIDLSFANVG